MSALRAKFELRTLKTPAGLFLLRAIALSVIVVIALLSLAYWRLNCVACAAWVRVIFGVLLLIGMMVHHSSMIRRHKVLWIRRFHRGSQSHCEQSFLESVVAPTGRLITLADSDLQNWAGARLSRFLFITIAIFSAACLVGKAFGLGVSKEALIGLFIGVGTGGRLVDGGQIKLTKANWEKQLHSLLHKKSLEMYLGGAVLTCPQNSEIWREVIESLAPSVEAVIISATECTPQIEWEVRTLRTALSARKMVIFETGGDLSRLPIFEGMSILDVPGKVPRFPRGETWKSAAAIIGAAINASRVSDKV